MYGFRKVPFESSPRQSFTRNSTRTPSPSTFATTPCTPSPVPSTASQDPIITSKLSLDPSETASITRPIVALMPASFDSRDESSRYISESGSGSSASSDMDFDYNVYYDIESPRRSKNSVSITIGTAKTGSYEMLKRAADYLRPETSPCECNASFDLTEQHDRKAYEKRRQLGSRFVGADDLAKGLWKLVQVEKERGRSMDDDSNEISSKRESEGESKNESKSKSKNEGKSARDEDDHGVHIFID